MLIAVSYKSIYLKEFSHQYNFISFHYSIASQPTVSGKIENMSTQHFQSLLNILKPLPHHFSSLCNLTHQHPNSVKVNNSRLIKKQPTFLIKHILHRNRTND